MGRAGIRRPRAVREADARRLPGRAVVDHHPAQARQFPPRLRRLRAGEDRALHAEEGRAPDAGRRHRAQPPEDRGHRAVGARLSRRSWRRAPASRSCCGTSATASRRSTISARIKQVPAETAVSRAMSKELPARGFKFVGPTIVYAFMQAVGMVNDHLVTCHRHAACKKLRASEPSPRDAAKRTGKRGAARLAAHAVGAPARPARPLPARRRDRGHRPRAGAGRALERPDHGRAHLLGGAALPAGRDHRAPALAARPPGAASRCCCTTRPNT